MAFDQIQDNYTGDPQELLYTDGPTFRRIGQSFTVGAGVVNITGVFVKVKSNVSFPQTVTLRLYNTVGEANSGIAPIATGTYDTTILWVENIVIPFSTRATVVPGNSYFITLTVASSDGVYSYVNRTAPYTGGQMYIASYGGGGGTTNYVAATGDLLFKTEYMPVRTAAGSASGGGSGTLEYESANVSASGSASGGGSAAIFTVYQALPQKDYEYRVFDAAGNYIGMWDNVENEFNYSQTINQNASELNVTIPRSPDNIKYSYSVLKDQTGDPILDENSKPISVSTSAPNAVGPDTDIDLNYKVEVWAFYGGYDQLLDENSDPILDSDGEAILSQYGSPNGKRVYTGYIADYSLSFGRRAGVKVVIAPHATEMSHYIFMDGTSTTVEYNSADPATMARDAITNYNAQGGLIEYTDETIPLSGAVSSYDFKLQTTREAMDKVVDLLPSGFYHYVHPGENLQYLLEKSSTANHIFWYEQHISELDLRKSITQLINKVYVVGGEISPGVDLFKYYEDAPSITANRAGLERIADSRVTLASTAEILADSKIEDYKDPRYRTSVTITDAVYDIEAIRLGQMVAFRNFGSYVDDLLLQIVSFQRRTHSITLDLDMVVAGENKRIQDLKRNLLSQEIRDIPDTPS